MAGTRSWEARGWDAPWVTFCIKLIAVLQGAGVTPVLVFDGRRLPAKAATNAGRRQRRQEARQRAERLMQEVGGVGHADEWCGLLDIVHKHGSCNRHVGWMDPVVA